MTHISSQPLIINECLKIITKLYKWWILHCRTQLWNKTENQTGSASVRKNLLLEPLVPCFDMKRTSSGMSNIVYTYSISVSYWISWNSQLQQQESLKLVRNTTRHFLIDLCWLTCPVCCISSSWFEFCVVATCLNLTFWWKLISGCVSYKCKQTTVLLVSAMLRKDHGSLVEELDWIPFKLTIWIKFTDVFALPLLNIDNHYYQPY